MESCNPPSQLSRSGLASLVREQLSVDPQLAEIMHNQRRVSKRVIALPASEKGRFPRTKKARKHCYRNP